MSLQTSDSIQCFFDHLGRTGDAVDYNEATRALTFNIDCEFIRTLREQGNSTVLAAVAAGHIAHEVSESMAEFTWIYRVMMERICPTSPPASEATR